MAYTQLIPRHTTGARVEEISRESAHYRLSIPSGFSDSYRLAQIDDYANNARGQFPHRAPRSLSLSARTSSDSIAGTWGFGLWNDPFGLSLGFGGNPFRLPALPNAAWFFGASEENYLSFRDSRADQSDEGISRSTVELPGTSAARAQLGAAANGFLAQTFRAPKFHPLLIVAGLILPFSRRRTRQIMSRVIEEDGIQLWNPTARHRVQALTPAPLNQSQSVDPTQWHRYRLDWSLTRVSFEVDEVLMFGSSVSPNPPLGLVIWIDNQYAAFTPEPSVKIGFGVLANPEPAWLEVKEIELKPA
jgi:hypothetical protein